MSPERPMHPFAEGYYRKKWAIYLFDQSRELLEVYRLFSVDLHDAARKGDRETLLAGLIAHYERNPVVFDVEEAAKDASDVLLLAAQLEDEVLTQSLEYPGKSEADILLERANRQTAATEISSIMAAYHWTQEGLNS